MCAIVRRVESLRGLTTELQVLTRIHDEAVHKMATKYMVNK